MADYSETYEEEMEHRFRNEHEADLLADKVCQTCGGEGVVKLKDGAPDGMAWYGPCPDCEANHD